MNKSISLSILSKAYDYFDPKDYPFLRDYKAQVMATRPYEGLKVLHNVHITYSTLCKIETLICGGAEVTVTATNDLIRNPDAMALLLEAGVSFVEQEDLQDDFDIVLDCCAGIYNRVTPRIGAVELTQTGSVIYKENAPSYPVISVDDSMTKNLENFYGTGDGCIRGLTELIPTSIKNKKFILFGYGKVGKGIAYYLRAHSDQIVVVEKSVNAIADAVRHGCKGVYYNDFKAIEKELKNTFCVITATGEENLLSNLYSEKIFSKVKYFANIGSHDELGGKFEESDKRVLYKKRPINFALEEPTRIKYLDPIFYLHNAAIDVLQTTPRQIGVYSFPIEKDLAVLRKWSGYHKVDTSLIFDEGVGAFTASLTQNLLSYIPCYVYWKDKNSMYQGCNHLFAKAAGLDFPSQIIGKSDFDLIWGATHAELFQQSDSEVIAGDLKINFIESQYQADGTTKTVLASKVPYFDEQGNVAGVLGIYVDVTDREERDRLKIENQLNKSLLQEHERFEKLARQVSHDISSPLASLLMLIETHQKDIPEEPRIAMRSIAGSIRGIANNLLNYNAKITDSSGGVTEQSEDVLLSSMILQFLSEKELEYKNLSVQLDCEFTKKGNFAFIKVQPTEFRRSLSNIVNNARDAFDGKKSKITLKLDVVDEWVKITIEDNGKGMPPEVAEKIMNNVAVTVDKKDGHGYGMAQVREMLQGNQGELSIDATVGKGTKIILTFSRVKTPSWIADEIKLGSQDIVVILDDDKSIHLAWGARFETVLKDTPSIQVEHFEEGAKALDFIGNLSAGEKKKIFLLTDYELLSQGLNGLDVVEKSKVARSILVTSHYMNKSVHDHASKLATKVLPKQLAAIVPITIDLNIKYTASAEGGLKKVDLVMVDDNKMFADIVIMSCFSDKVVDHFEDPRHFLDNVAKYPKDTEICLDNNFETGDMTGMQMAKKLHEEGYTQLYMLSGESFSQDEIPNYLTVIRKDNIENIKNILVN